MSDKLTAADLSEVTRIATSEDERVIYVLQRAEKIEAVEKERGGKRYHAVVVEMGGTVVDMQKHDGAEFTEAEAERAVADAGDLVKQLDQESADARAAEEKKAADAAAEEAAFLARQALLVADTEGDDGRRNG